MLYSTARDVRGELAHVRYACVPKSTLCTPTAQTVCGTEPRPRQAPHPQGASSRHTASPCRVERQGRRGQQQRGGQSAPASVTSGGQVGYE